MLSVAPGASARHHTMALRPHSNTTPVSRARSLIQTTLASLRWIWRRRSKLQMGCPAFVPGFLLCGHSRLIIPIAPTRCRRIVAAKTLLRKPFRFVLSSRKWAPCANHWATGIRVSRQRAGRDYSPDRSPIGSGRLVMITLPGAALRPRPALTDASTGSSISLW